MKSFNELKAEAASKGINTFKMNKVQIIEALEGVKSEKNTGRGRPVNSNSARQKRLSLVGTLKRGRPVDPNSDWNKKQRELEAKRKKGELKRGRPVDPNSARQQKIDSKETV